MSGKYNFGDMSRERLIELAREWSGKDTIWGNNEKIEESSDASLRKWLSCNQPCPAVKRNGEVCAGLPVSVAGYCFAHDPELAYARAAGGRAKGKKVRAQKKLRELGLDDMVKGLREVFNELQAAPPSANNARAMAKIADTIMKMTEMAAETDKEPKPAWDVGWPPYMP